MNAFKFGTIVSDEFFTDRQKELEYLKRHLDSENHIILISPRRYGKSSLVRKCLTETGRPFAWIDMQYTLSVSDFATRLLKQVLSLYTYERLKYEIRHFRIIPTFSTNPLTNEWQVGFQPTADHTVVLEDVMQLLQRLTDADKRLIVVLDEFQEVRHIGKQFDRQLRALMQHQQGLNYIFLGSQESMMQEIFEKKKSPFYHFGQLMRLDKIPYQDFYQFVSDRLPEVNDKDGVVRSLLSFTACHPYYTQQLAAQVWEKITYDHLQEHIVEQSIESIVEVHSVDFERLWSGQNRTDRAVVLALANNENPLQNRAVATSTTFSALKRLQQNGLVVRTETGYELEDPFFCRWLSEL